MAYRRKYGNSRSTTPEEIRLKSDFATADEYLSRSSLAAHAIRASSGHSESSLSAAYGDSVFSSSVLRRESDGGSQTSSPQDSNSCHSSEKSLNESKYGFWDVVARKARSVLEDDNAFQQRENSNRNQHPAHETSSLAHLQQFDHLPRKHDKKESPKLQKGLTAITSSLSYIGGKVGNALEEGISAVENKTTDIIQETRKLNMRRKETISNTRSQTVNSYAYPSGTSQVSMDQELQLKAARDVANAMAAKAKLLVRELKTVKADLAFAKERCAQLEEENKVLRETREKGVYPEDDDLIRLQLETLLAEKARLAHENSLHARENRFLREIVEYHQLTMQDVVYLDEGSEEVTEVYSIPASYSHGAPGTPPGHPNPWIPAPSNLSTSLPVPMRPMSTLKTSAQQPHAKIPERAL